jgi:hypothetical protein
LIVLVVNYVLCIAAGLLFGWTMYQVWMPLLPGFTWPLTVKGFLMGFPADHPLAEIPCLIPAERRGWKRTHRGSLFSCPLRRL